MILRFTDCELDTDRYTLRRHGQPIAVQPRVLDLLIHLARAGDRVVSRTELHQTVWRGVVVSETALSYAIKEARRAIDDDGAEQRMIQTVRGRGFRFVPPVFEVAALSRPEPGPVDPFVGRREALAAFESELGAALDGAGRFVLLEGEPGIGKSRTLSEIAARARSLGFRVLIGRGVEGVGAPAYWPWTQMLRQLLDASDRPLLPADAAGVIARTMPDLAALLPETGGQPPLDLPNAREVQFRLFDALTRIWTTLARSQPLLLGFDDLHRADPGSLSLLGHIVREVERAPVLGLGTCSSAALVADSERGRQLGELLRGPCTRSLLLSGLDRSEVAELVATLHGEAPSEEQLDELMQRTGGNPFFVREIVAIHAPFAGAALPETVRQAVLRHLDGLPESCRQLLAKAAVLGRRFELAVLASLARLAPDVVLAELDRAVAARVLEPGDPGSSTFQFVHALIPEALGTSLPAGELRSLHAGAARALEARSASRSDAVVQIAHHLVRAVPAVDRDVAVAACRRAAQRARERFAHDEAAALLEQALHLVSAGPCDEAAELAFLLELADAQLVATRLEAARTTCARAAELARRTGRAESLARAALGFAGEQDDARMDPMIVDLLEEAANRLDRGDSPLRACVQSRLAGAIYYGPEMERAAALSHDAVAMARRCGDPVTLGHTLKGRHWSAWTPENLEERETIAVELLDLAVATANPELEHEAHAFGISNALERGDRAATEARWAAYVGLARRGHRLLFDWHLEHYRVMRHLLERDAEAAERALQRAFQLGQQTRYDLASTWFGIQLYGVRREQGRLAELAPVMRQMARDYPMTPWRLAVACEDARAGLRDQGSAALHAFLGDGPRHVRRDLAWITSFWYLAELCAQLGAGAEGSAVEAALLPFAERHVVVGVGMLYLGPVAHALGAAVEAQGRHRDAQGWFAQARARDLRATAAG